MLSDVTIRSCTTSVIHYSALHGFWPVELPELADGPTESGEVARGRCLFAWNFRVTRSAVLTEGERRIGPNMTLSLYWRLAPSLPFEKKKLQRPETMHCTIFRTEHDVLSRVSTCSWAHVNCCLPTCPHGGRRSIF
jgi:hypothetical protein